MSTLSALPLLALGCCGLGVAYLLMRAAPRATFVAWALVLFFVPIWVGASVGFFWSVTTGVTLLAVLAGGARLHFTVFDGLVAFFVVLVLGLFGLGLVTVSGAVQAVLEWVLPYAWGRVVLSRVSSDLVSGVLAGAAVGAAALALIEAVSGTNLFLLLPAGAGSSFATWGILQERGGMVRVEGAFGHSIALGATLGLCSAFLLASRWRTPAKVLGLAVVAGATVLTFSRIGLITLVLAAVLTVVLLPQLSLSTRVAVVAAGVVAAVMAIPVLSAVFLEAGDEAGGSADYRFDLLALVPQLQPFGSAGNWRGLVAGGQYLGAYASSIDNAVLVMAVRLGWVPTVLLVLVIAGVATKALRRDRTSPAAIAVAAQLPGLVAVAFITQFGMFFWFVVGLAVAWPPVVGQPRADAQHGLDGRADHAGQVKPADEAVVGTRTGPASAGDDVRGGGSR